MARGRCHPLTVVDDHSRYALGVEACENEQDATVRESLIRIFRRYGLPFVLLMDNGSPWADPDGLTMFEVWLIRLGVRVAHGRPRHPQTQGKDERFNRSLKAEVLNRCSYRDLPECQRAFDRWRHIYNHERPHVRASGLSRLVSVTR
jgi:transposase InsO family protein